MTNQAEEAAGIEVTQKAGVKNGPPCPGRIAREGGQVECDRVAIAVVEARTMYKCAYGHRWRRLT